MIALPTNAHTQSLMHKNAQPQPHSLHKLAFAPVLSSPRIHQLQDLLEGGALPVTHDQSHARCLRSPVQRGWGAAGLPGVRQEKPYPPC